MAGLIIVFAYLVGGMIVYRIIYKNYKSGNETFTSTIFAYLCATIFFGGFIVIGALSSLGLLLL